MPPVSGINAIDPAIRPAFETAYENSFWKMQELLGPLLEFNVPCVSETNTYAYPESAIHPTVWRRGEDVGDQGFQFRKFTAVVKDWVARVTWHENDERYDQTKMLVRRAEASGNNMARIAWRVFFQLLTASTNTKLLPVIPNAPDGAALYSATDGGGNNRFGASGGNIVTQTGTTGVAVQNDLYSVVQRFANFQDTEGEELWPSDMLQGGMTIVHGPSMVKAVNDAFQQRLNVTAINASGTEASSAVVAAGAKSNVILDSGFSVRTLMSAKITTTKIYVFLDGAPDKAIFHLSPPDGALRSTFEDMTNSDRSRKTKMKCRQWDKSEGYAIFLPYQTCVVQ